MGSRTLGVLFLAALVTAPMPARAKSFSPDLGGFFICPDRTAGCDSGQVRQDIEGFKDYATQIGAALAPRFLGPAGSTGGNGWEVVLNTGFGKVSTDAPYWRGQPTTAGTPTTSTKASSDDFMVVSQVGVRKGLPYSFRIGGQVSHLYDSSLWAIGLELGWAALEGYKNAPDIGFVGSVGTVLGSSDFLMVDVHAGVVLSKSFSVAGLFSLAPFAGYDMMYINASTHLTNTYAAGATTPTVMAIDPLDIVRHRVFLGLDAIITYAVLGMEMNVDVQSARLTYAFKAGVQF